MFSDESVDADICSCCGEEVGYDRDTCSKGTFIGFPHVRLAKKMRDALLDHYARAKESAAARGVEREYERLIALLDRALVSLNLELRVAGNLLSGQAYRSYYAAVDERQRQIAKRLFHADRLKVDAVIHTGYAEKIVNLALSPDGRGLPNYGPVSFLLKEASISARCALLRENAFAFHARFSLGDVGAIEEPGWRSVWGDRAMLGAAALEPDLRPGMSDEDIRAVIHRAGPTRPEDRFMEVHLYDAMMWEYVEAAYLGAELQTPQERVHWGQIKEDVADKGIRLIGAPHG